MKKHKRDQDHRSFVKGYQAAIQERSFAACPYQEPIEWRITGQEVGARDAKITGMDLIRLLSSKKPLVYKALPVTI